MVTEIDYLTFKMADKKERVLFAFDFDNTVVNDNTDLWILRCSPRLPKLEEHVRAIRKDFNCWTDVMAHVFQTLHKNECTQEEIVDWMKKLRPLPAFESFLQKSTSYPSLDVVIISDSNSLFIETILDEHDCSKGVQEVHTNPASFNENGCLIIKRYHAHTCDTCKKTPNLCKGSVLDHVISRGSYNRVVYVGDGHNDVCPSMKLTTADTVIARKGYALAKQLQHLSAGSLKPKLHVVDFTKQEEMQSVLESLLPTTL